MKKKPRLKEKPGEVIEKDFLKGNRNLKRARFEKEKSMYKKLEKTDIKTPELIEAKNSEKKLLLEKIKPREKTKKDNENIIDTLIEFQFSGLKPKENIFLKISDNPSIRLFYSSLVSIKNLGFIIFFRILKELITYHLFYKKTKQGILLHNDFFWANVLKEKKEIKLLDLESATTSRRWLFKDIVWFVLKRDNMENYNEMLGLYIKKLKSKKPWEYKRINVEKEIKMVIIKRCVNCIMRKSPYSDYFLNILNEIFDDKKKRKWIGF